VCPAAGGEATVVDAWPPPAPRLAVTVIVPVALAVNNRPHAADRLPTGASRQIPPLANRPVGLANVTCPDGGCAAPTGPVAVAVHVVCCCAVNTLGEHETRNDGAPCVLTTAGTVIVAVAGADVPPGPLAWNVNESVPENPGLDVYAIDPFAGLIGPNDPCPGTRSIAKLNPVPAGPEHGNDTTTDPPPTGVDAATSRHTGGG
jgi:hypothetical protein